MTLASSQPEAGMVNNQLMSFAEFEAYVASNEWVNNDDFDPDSHPDHTWFQVNTAAVSQCLEKCCTMISKALGIVPRGDVELRHLERNVLELRNVVHGPAKKIFCMGSAGIGKSSLFNALFNTPGLAKTAAKGDACTSVVVQYSATTQNDSEGFQVKIVFLQPATIKDFVEAHSKVYFQRNFSTPEPEEFDNDIESTEVKQIETARKFFSLIFGEEDDFKKYFTSRTFQDGSFQKLCFEKSLAKLTEIGMDHQTFTKQRFFQDVEEFQDGMEGYMADVPDKECYWHLVDRIEIKCPFPILRHNVEFVDSPGLGELNQTRMASTNRAKDGADLLCIIGDTDRIKANELIMDSAVQAIAQHGPEKVAMIATKTDVLVDQDVLQELGPIYQRAREVLSWIRIKKTMATKQKIDKKIIRQLFRYERYVIRTMKEAFVLDRARDLRSQVPDTLKELSDRNLADGISAIEVFSVSSAQYMKWAENSEFLFDQVPELSIETTGLPALRRHFLSLAADQNLCDYQHHVNKFFPNLIAKIHRVIDPSRSASFTAISHAFASTIDSATTDFSTTLTHALSTLSSQNLPILLTDKGHYLSCLDHEATSWSHIRYCTFRKMLREHGILSPGASRVLSLRRGYNINRNMARILTPAFRSLARHLRAQYVDLAASLEKVRKRINALVTAAIDSAASDLRSIKAAKKLWAPRSLALSTPITRFARKLEQMAESVSGLASRETDYLSFVAKRTARIFEAVYVARPKKVTRALKKKRGANGEPVMVTEYEAPVGVFAREMLLRLLKEGGEEVQVTKEEEAGEVEQEGDIVEKIMVELDGMVQRRFKAYANECVEGIRAILREYLDEVAELAPAEVEITEEGLEARERLKEIVEELERRCEEVRGLVPDAA